MRNENSSSDHKSDHGDRGEYDALSTARGVATPLPILLTVTLSKGTAVIPAWILVLFASLFVIASASSVTVLFIETLMMKEVRVLQIYEEDIENVLIRSNIATRSDFSYHPTK